MQQLTVSPGVSCRLHKRQHHNEAVVPWMIALQLGGYLGGAHLVGVQQMRTPMLGQAHTCSALLQCQNCFNGGKISAQYYFVFRLCEFQRRQLSCCHCLGLYK